MKRIILTALACSASFGCGDPIKDAQRIEELRVLGAQVQVSDAPERATPEPGEAAQVTWLLADPSGRPPSAVWSMQICVGEESSYGVPYCRDEPFASVEQGEPGDATPILEFTVPSRSELGDSARLVVLAIFCDGGTLELGADLESSDCRGATTVQKASLDIFVDDGEEPNQNPDLSTATLLFDGADWPEDTSTDCESGELVSVAADGKEHSVTLGLPDVAREELPPVFGEVLPESLQVSQLATLGMFDRRFSGVAGDDADLSIHVPWKAPGELGETTPSGVYFVVRDGRGGTSWLTRTLCVQP